MKKVIVFHFILLGMFLITPFCFAEYSSIKVSPLNTRLTLSVKGQQNCTIFYALPDKNMQLTSRWSKNFPGKESNYNLSSEQLKLKINYTRLEYGKYQFCFDSEKNGVFYGLIFFQPEDSLARMGTWIELDVTGRTVYESISLITGDVIRNTGNLNFSLGLIFLLLVITLLLAIRRSFRHARLIKDKHP